VWTRQLVAFTVQLTAQRDVLMSDLDKTYPLHPASIACTACWTPDVPAACSYEPRRRLLDCFSWRSCTRQLLQKATTDAQRARKLADDLSATTGLRQRKAGGASSGDDGPSSPHAATVTKTSKDQGVRRSSLSVCSPHRLTLLSLLLLADSRSGCCTWSCALSSSSSSAATTEASARIHF
jgi:hypothetical protein